MAERPQDTFFEESNEMLAAMENALLALEQAPGDADLINSLFRSVHTIKGTAGVFGFDGVVSFTHVVESALDKVRAGELELTSELNTLLLSCRDHIAVLVRHAVEDSVVSDAAAARDRELLAELRQFASVSTQGAVAAVAPEVKPAAKTGGVVPSVGVNNKNWHISLRFSPEVLRHGMDPLSFLRYLTRMGELAKVIFVNLCNCSLQEMDAETCYTGLEISFCSDADREKIERVFDFVREDCRLVVLPPRAKIEEYLALIEKMDNEQDRIGEMLVRCGALTQRELEEALSLQGSARESAEGEAPRLGEVIVDRKMVAKEVVDKALHRQQENQGKTVISHSIRVDAAKLDKLVNLVGEMVIAGASTKLIAHTLGNSRLMESMSVMSRLVEEIRDSALRLRMIPIGDMFNRFQRVVRDVSKELGKNIRLEVNGGDTELDKTVIEKISDPLMHLVRNAMDHGLEAHAERSASGKEEVGTVQLNAYHDAGSIVIEVADDGRGLDEERILTKARQQGLVAEGVTLQQQDIFRLIFEPGFSTATAVTNLSGRGVGMDVVRKNIEALRGSVDIESEFGQGTIIRIRLPLTLAIIDGFLVTIGESSYVIPLDMIHECVEMESLVNTGSGKRKHVNLRGEVLPLLYLRDFFAIDDQRVERENIVVVQFGSTKAGLVVDNLIGEFQTVIKPMGRIFRDLKGVSGSTILGSGEVAIILDVPGLIQEVAEHNVAVSAGMNERNAMTVWH